MLSFANEHIDSPKQELLQDPLALWLVEAGLLTQEVALRALLAGRREEVGFVGYLVSQEQIDSESLARSLAQYLGWGWVDLGQVTVDGLPKDLLDEQFVQLHRVLPLAVEEKTLYLVTAEPLELGVLGEIKFHTDLNIVPVVGDWEKLSRLLAAYLTEKQYQALGQQVANTINSEHDERIVEMVQQILLDAVKQGASDIHVEPYKTAYRIRLRIDGILHKVTQLSVDLGLRVTARLKILARLDIAERRLPQDGRFSIEMNAQEHRDCRISTCPTSFGEKTVVRILDGGKTILNIADLGMQPEQKTLFIKAIHKPQGMLLVTGPTGSGKTVTLYTALNLLNTLDKNIVTAEEPVEVQLPGINQVHINTKTELTFAKVLRAFLRQDPDIIMVGEIRDKETADIAMKAAQTGHLVLSTLHANSAAETISRLLMMGMSAFNIVHSLHLIIAQRLVRKLCDHCKQEKEINHDALLAAGFDQQMLQKFSSSANEYFKLYEPIGCQHCAKGYKGRAGIFEILPIVQEIANTIMNEGTSADIVSVARNMGMVSLREAALQQLLNGVTSLAEIQRVML